MLQIAMEAHTTESTAAILFNNAIAVLNESKPTPSRLDDALKPCAVTQWTRGVINHISITKVNRLFG